jgi:hypothetical protein
MFEKLKQKWKVGPLQLLLILVTFALGGSACGYVGKLIMKLTAIENRALWVILYIVLITVLWPLCVLIISFPMGQFGFFKNYVAKIARKLTIKR